MPSLKALRTQLALGKPTPPLDQSGKELPTLGEAQEKSWRKLSAFDLCGLEKVSLLLGPLRPAGQQLSHRTQGKRPDSKLPLADDMNSAISSRLPSLVHTHREQQDPVLRAGPSGSDNESAWGHSQGPRRLCCLSLPLSLQWSPTAPVQREPGAGRHPSILGKNVVVPEAWLSRRPPPGFRGDECPSYLSSSAALWACGGQETRGLENLR